MLKHLFNAQTFVRVLFKHAAHEVDDTGGAPFPTRRLKLDWCTQHGLVCFWHAITSERHFSGDKIEEDYAQCPNIGPFVVKAVFTELLWRHVAHRAAKALEFFTRFVNDCFAEVGQLEVIDETFLINGNKNVI